MLRTQILLLMSFSLNAAALPDQEAGQLPEIDIGERQKSPTVNDDAPGIQGESQRELLAPLPFPIRGSGGVATGTNLAAEAERYRKCLAAAEQEDGGEALALARDWMLAGIGLPALHCVAVARFADRDFEGAVDALRQMADDLRAGREAGFDPGGSDGPRLLLAGVLSQLGNALILTGLPEDAYTALSQGIAEAPVSAQGLLSDLYLDRGRALALSGDVASAIPDLEKALRLAPARDDIYYFLASGRRLLGDYDDAAAAIARAIEMRDDIPGYYLERGNIRMMVDDMSGARSDWLRTVSDWPESEAAEAARINLERLYELMAEEAAKSP